ncbi:MAG TPA: aldehyde dehydrogenase family protein [Burkholderiaceae bacterium]|nr:aldehyde dehydrogenase family protein [Burkholderiaceae bacterium]
MARSAADVLQAVDPATRELVASVFATSHGSVPAIVVRAQEAGRTWSTLPFAQRAPALTRLRELVAQRAHEIAETIAHGMGKPLIEALAFEVAAVLETLDDCIAHATDALADQPIGVSARVGGNKTLVFRHTPHAVVCVIAPVSFPFERAMTPAVIALAAGSAVIVKPTSAAPLVGALIERLLDEAFADFPGLAQVAHGSGAIGAAVATADGVDCVLFTGSTRVGSELRTALAPLQRPARLELAGANPLIVCDDANLERAARATVFGRFSNNGQGCASVRRVYVQRTVAAAFIHKVVHKVRALKSGPYTNPFCEIGPLANGRGLEDLRAVLQDALDKRALLAAGGFPAHVTGRNNGERRGADRQGWYWPPTVLTNVDTAMRVMQETVAGPILPIQVVDDDAEAIALANDTYYGFDACVFSGDLARANRIADQLRAGTVAINDVLVNMALPNLHCGSTQQAGIDHDRGGDAGRATPFGVGKVLLIDDGSGDSEPHWFPYSAAKLQAIERAQSAARPAPASTAPGAGGDE